MADKMTSKERMLVAMTGGIPDTVPVTPDISNMIPAKRTGRPFWDVYLYSNPSLGKAYLDACEYYDIDAWYWYVGLGHSRDDKREFHDEITSQTDDRIVVRTTCHTPEGDLWQETTYYKADPPTVTSKWIKDLRQDFNKLKYFFPDPRQGDITRYKMLKDMVGDRGIVGFWINYPIIMFDWRDGSENAYFDYYDNYDLVKEYAAMYDDWAVKSMEAAIAAKPDFIQTGQSGSLTLQSPEIFRDISMPTLVKICKMAKEASIPTMLHSCGKEKLLVKWCVEETDLNCINPLEKAPMGDCDLAEIKQLYGDKIALMGNVHTTDVMLRGTPDDVERAVIECMDAAKAGGGFILSTGDQCGRDTPEENLRRFVEAGRYYGKY